MATLHGEGFETFALGNDRAALLGCYDFAGDSLVGDFEIVSNGAGGQALAVDYTGQAWAVAIGGLTSDATLIRSFRFRADALPGADHELLVYHDAENDELATWAVTSTGSIKLLRGRLSSGTLIDQTAAGVVTAGAWVYLQTKITLDGSAGAYELRSTRPGEAELVDLSGSGANTTAGGTRAYQLWHGGDAARWRYDDCVLIDTSAGRWTDFMGEVRGVRSAPNAANVNQWVGSNPTVDGYTLIDEDDADDDATRVRSDVAGEIESNEYQSVPTDRRVTFVASRPVLRKDDAGTRTVVLRVDSSGQVGESSPYPLSAGYVRLNHIWETDPNTGGLWGPAALNLARFGVKVGSP